MDCLAYDLIVSKILAAICFVAILGFGAVVLWVTWRKPHNQGGGREHAPGCKSFEEPGCDCGAMLP